MLAAALNTPLIRLQCYEGIDVSTAVYEWNYTRQMLHIRLMEASGINRQQELKEIFGPEFLIKRPLLQAIDAENASAPVLFIDELDRSDEEFEAYLLELLSDFQITIPEIGTIVAKDVQPHARDSRCSASSLPVLLDRFPNSGKRIFYRPGTNARCT